MKSFSNKKSCCSGGGEMFAQKPTETLMYFFLNYTPKTDNLILFLHNTSLYNKENTCTIIFSCEFKTYLLPY